MNASIAQVTLLLDSCCHNVEPQKTIYVGIRDFHKKRIVVFGEDHPKTLATMYNLACNYNSQGQYDKAEPLFEACLKKRTAVLGEDHPDTLASMDNLASNYAHQGQYGKAEPLYEHGQLGKQLHSSRTV